MSLKILNFSSYLLLLILTIVTPVQGYLLSSYIEKTLIINFFDIGQGDSFLIKTPDGYNMLIDGGRDLQVISKLEKYLNPFERLDYVVLTHADADHIGGLSEVVMRYKVQNILHNKNQKEHSEIYQEFLGVISGLNNVNTFSGDTFKFGCCVEIKTFNPNFSQSETEEEKNEKSISFLLSYGNFRFFSGGDIYEETENKIAESVINSSGKNIDLLKINHHGSETSTSDYFLEHLLPEYSVIQVGEGNSYGHPYNGTLDGLLSYNVNTLRNDLHGDVIYETDGKNYSLITNR